MKRKMKKKNQITEYYAFSPIDTIKTIRDWYEIG